MGNNNNETGLRPPPKRGPQERAQSFASQRSTSSLSTTSNDSTTAAQTAAKRMPVSPLPLFNVPPRPSTAASFGFPANNASQTNFSRPATLRANQDDHSRTQRSNAMASVAGLGHRRQHSQGFFEPSLPTASASNMSASAIAAAAAMNHLGPPTPNAHERKRSITGLSAISAASSSGAASARGVVSPSTTSPPNRNQEYLGFPSPEDGRAAAANAAYAAFPKSPMAAPTLTQHESPTSPPRLPPVVPEKEIKPKEKSKMKLFSKPKAISITKDSDKKLPSLPSPAKPHLNSVFPNLSTTSLAETSTSGSNSLYSSANPSTSTLVPPTTTSMGPPPPPSSDKHRPHFLSRQKLRHGDKTLLLSSASSNSQAVDPSAPTSLYSFVPQSPGMNSTFLKSVTGLDLRHGGKGLRDRWKEEKAAASLGVAMPGSSLNLSSDHRSEFLGPSSLESSFLGPLSASSTSIFQSDLNPSASAVAFNNLGTNMGLSGITPDDAWPLLKARLLAVFEGEDVRTPVEDFNLLVSVHVRRCVQKRSPHVLVEDLREFLQTGFASLSQTLRFVPDERIVPNLVEMWQMVYCRVLPFIQAVFLPLDLEFRGAGNIMTAKEAQEFWGAMPETPRTENGRQSLELIVSKPLSRSEELDVRRMTLICFRDTVIMARHDTLLNIFSRLSLDNINSIPSETVTVRSRGISNPVDRPSTAQGIGSLSPRLSSYSSQTSTLADTTSSPSTSVFPSGRSRATSSVSAGSFGTSLPHLPSPLQQGSHTRTRSSTFNVLPPPEMTPAATATDYGAGNVTDTVARMLQCVSILSSLQTRDKGQAATEQLTGALKHNWLGRGRMGRQRKGFVGTRVATVVGGVSA